MRAGQIHYAVAYEHLSLCSFLSFAFFFVFFFNMSLFSKNSSDEEPEKGKPSKAEEHPKGETFAIHPNRSKRGKCRKCLYFVSVAGISGRTIAPRNGC